MTELFARTQVAKAVAGTLTLFAPVLALAAGFQLNENSASGLGNAFAGGAAVAEDASTLWSNAAGMSRIRSPQVVGALHLVKPSIKFHDRGYDYLKNHLGETGAPVARGFEYNSGTNPIRYSVEQIREFYERTKT